jgi:hypothetical protein
MTRTKHILEDPVTESTILGYVAMYFPFIDEPLEIKYRHRVYEVPTTQKTCRFEEEFFVSYDCAECKINCCGRNWGLGVGFDGLWKEKDLETVKNFKAKKYAIYLNGKKTYYYVGKTGYACKFQQEKKCLIWDSAEAGQNRPMGCHFYPMSWYWVDNMVTFTRSCEEDSCKWVKSYSRANMERDLNTLYKMCKEVELVGLKANYEPIKVLEASFANLK